MAASLFTNKPKNGTGAGVHDNGIDTGDEYDESSANDNNNKSHSLIDIAGMDNQQSNTSTIKQLENTHIEYSRTHNTVINNNGTDDGYSDQQLKLHLYQRKK